MTSTFAEAQEALAASLPGYTRRPHQMDLAVQVEAALASQRAALLQAGCGTGKSLAALIPAILSGKRTVFGTATKALQNQYIGDLQFLQDNLGTDFTWAILKGRSNYPCLLKIRDLASPSFAQQKVLGAIAEAGEDEIPDRETLPAVPGTEWAGVSMGSAECPGRKHCPFGKQCFAERAKDKAASAQIVVTNLAYLLQDLLLRQRSNDAVSLLGDYEQLVIDEAHNLPDVATSALEDSIGEGALIRLGHDLAGFFNDQYRDPAAAEDVSAQAGELWGALAVLFAGRNRGNRQPDPVRLAARDILGLADQLTAVLDVIETARAQVLAVKGLDPEDPAYIARQRLLRRCDDWHARISAVLLSEDDIRWLEENEVTVRGTKERRLFLRTAPLSAGPFLREVIWDATPAVMLSATLATGRDRRTGAPDFSYLREGCGLKPGEAIEFDAGTPFDFASQALLYVPAKGLPEPSGAATQSWRVFAQQATEQLVRAADGNALLLYTSRANLNDAYQRLAPAFRQLGLTVLKQDDAPTPELIRQLKAGRAVLFGLKSFFEGVDIQGEAVSLVVIDKLPFAVPTDVLVKARAEALVRRYGSWADFRMMTIPSMSLVLIQGTGRLIRHKTDRGVIAVLDPRLSSKSYGRQIIDSLPPAKVTRDITDAVRFLEGGIG